MLHDSTKSARSIFMARTLGGRTLRILAFYGLPILLLPLFSLTQAINAHASSLEVIPKDIHYKDVTPGMIRGSFQIVNNGRTAVRNIALYPSCGCMNIPNNRISVLNPGQNITIPFEINMQFTGKTMESVQVVANNEPTGVSVNITAQTFVPFDGLKWDGLTVPTIIRLSSLQDSNPINVTLHLKSGVDSAELSSISRDMRITSKTVGDKCVMTITALRTATDGDYEAGVRVKYSRGGKIGFANLNIEGVIQSKIQVQPRSLNYGFVKPGRTSVSQRIVIRKEAGIIGSIDLRPADREVKVESVSSNSREIIYAVSLHPSGRGELKYFADLYLNNLKLGSIELRVNVM